MADSYPGQEQMGKAWEWAQPHLLAAQNEFSKFTGYVGANWTNSGDAIDPIAFAAGAEADLAAAANKALADLKSDQNKVQYKQALDLYGTDADIARQFRISSLRDKLSEEGKKDFDNLMRDDAMRRVIAKHVAAGEPGADKLAEESRKHPELVAYALAHNENLGTGRLDAMGNYWDAGWKVWEKTNTEVPRNALSNFLDWAESIEFLGIGSIVATCRSVWNTVCEFIPNVGKTIYAVATGIFGKNETFAAALDEVKEENSKGRISAALDKAGLSSALANDLDALMRDPSSIGSLPPLATSPTPAPTPATPTSPAPPRVEEDPALLASAGTAAAAAVAKTPAAPAPARAMLAADTTRADAKADFKPEDAKVGTAWTNLVVAVATSAPLTPYMRTVDADGKVSSDPAKLNRPYDAESFTNITYDPAQREIAKYVTVQTALLDFDKKGPIYQKLLADYTRDFEEKLGTGSTSDYNTAKENAPIEAARRLEQERAVLQSRVRDFGSESARFSDILNDKRGTVQLLASDFPELKQQTASLMTLDEAARDVSVAGMLAYQQYKSDPAKLTDAVITALLDPAEALKEQKFDYPSNVINPETSLSGNRVFSREEVVEYAKWLQDHKKEIGEAISRRGEKTYQARTALTNGEVIGIQLAMDKAVTAGTLDPSTLSPELKALYYDKSINNNAAPMEFSSVAMLSNQAFDFLQSNGVSLEGIQTTKAIRDARTIATKTDAQILRTAVYTYGVIPEDSSGVPEILSNLEKNIKNASADTAFVGAPLPDATITGVAPLIVPLLTSSLSPEQQATQVLTQMAMLDEEKQRGLQEQRRSVREQIELGRRVAVNPSSTALGATVGITVADVEADSLAPNAPGGPTKTQGAQRADFA